MFMESIGIVLCRLVLITCVHVFSETMGKWPGSPHYVTTAIFRRLALILFHSEVKRVRRGNHNLRFSFLKFVSPVCLDHFVN